MRPFLLFLAITDLISAYFLIKGITHPLILLFLWIHSIKGFTSIIGSLAAGYYFDWMGLIDILAAVFIALIPMPIIGELCKQAAFYVGILMALKGAYSMVWGLL
ncbi:MAG: hypothetical protein QXZ43_03860 [Candidatus Aenigmatarchaeota archaeon]